MKNLQRIENELKLKKQLDLLREPIEISQRDGKYIIVNGKKIINLSSNDYLGLAANDGLRRKIIKIQEKYSISSSSSRLVTGNEKIIREVEQYFASFFGYEDAMFFTSGFMANVGLISSLFSAESTIFYDKHVHASVVTGLELNQAKKVGFKHNQTSHFSKRFAKHANSENWVILESLYSMDGESADYRFWESQKDKINLIVDEAHAYGILGEKGKGLFGSIADIAVGTFGKAFGYTGAFLLLPKIVRTYLENNCKAYIYTTGISPANAMVGKFLLDQIATMDAEREIVRNLSNHLRNLLRNEKISFQGKYHIIAIEIGDEGKAIQIQKIMQNDGFFVFASRFPTVPLGKAILRISLNPLISPKDLEIFVSKLRKLL